MNLNITAYIIYLLLTSIIILQVGNICYKNGNIFIQSLLKDNTSLAKQINKLLLIAYYLLNIGYCAMTLISWSNITTYTAIVEIISMKVGIIVLIISVMHYINIIIIQKFINKLI